MEKRLPLALILSVLVLVLYQAFLAPPLQRPEQQAEPTVADSLAEGSVPAIGELESRAVEGSSAPAGPDGDTDEGTPVEAEEVEASMGPAPAPPAGPAVGEVEERELILEFGTRGEPGHFRAQFTNRGAQLLDLRTGTYFRRVGLDDVQRDDPAYWLRLIEPVEPLRPSAAMGTFALDGIHSGRDLTDRLLSNALWEMTALRGADGAATGIQFRYQGPNGILFEKRVEAVPGTWDLGLTLSITSPDDLGDLAPGIKNFVMVASGAVGVEVEDSFYQQPKAVAAGPAGDSDPDLEKEVADLGARRVQGAFDVRGPLAAVGGHNKYFAVLLRPMDAAAQQALTTASWRRIDGYGPIDPDLVAAELATAQLGGTAAAPYILSEAFIDLTLPEPGGQESWNYRLYAGPKDHSTFLELSDAHRAVINSDLSWFSFIGNFLIDVLIVLEGVAGNWGVAIILLTLIIRLILFPLNRRAQTAMARYAKKMQRVQPKLNELKEKYPDDLQKQREGQAKIMQEEGAFPPVGGCLPIFLQMPVFFGLFGALRTSFDLRHAGFAGYIQDLSRPDQLFELGFTVPLLGWEYFNLLPILMVILWIWQQKTMPQPTDEQAQRMQRIMLFMPVIMGFVLYNYAAGLSLYMMTQSGLGVFEQKVIKKLWPIDDTEVETKKKGGCAPFAEAMRKAAEQQKEQQKRLEQQKKQLGAKKKKRK